MARLRIGCTSSSRFWFGGPAFGDETNLATHKKISSGIKGEMHYLFARELFISFFFLQTLQYHNRLLYSPAATSLT